MSSFGFNNRKIKNPSGSWSIDQLIGAKVLIKSSSVGNFISCFNFDSSKRLTIKNIQVRISIDGKAFTVIEVKEFPNKVFLWKDLEIVEINDRPLLDAVCGEFACNQSIVGYNVDTELTIDTGESDGGIALIDDNGTIITNRFVRFLGADVENLKTDKDVVTDITLNLDGDILD